MMRGPHHTTTDTQHNNPPQNTTTTTTTTTAAAATTILNPPTHTHTYHNPPHPNPTQGLRDASGMLFGLTAMKKDGAPTDLSLATDGGRGQLVGDQGASWRQRALKRAREEAARTGRRLEEVGVVRREWEWGGGMWGFCC